MEREEGNEVREDETDLGCDLGRCDVTRGAYKELRPVLQEDLPRDGDGGH